MPREVLQLPENKRCADCGARDPRWASVNIGVLICDACSGIHRKLGTHITQVRSVTLDEWRPEWVRTVTQVGNARGKAFYEHSVQEGERYHGCAELAGGGDRISKAHGLLLEQWIRAKYEEKRFAPGSAREPREEVNHESCKDVAAEAGTPGSTSWDNLPPPPGGRRTETEEVWRNPSSWPAPSTESAPTAGWQVQSAWPLAVDEHLLGCWPSSAEVPGWLSFGSPRGPATWPERPDGWLEAPCAPVEGQQPGRHPLTGQAAAIVEPHFAADSAALLSRPEEDAPRMRRRRSASVNSFEADPDPQAASCFPCLLGGLISTTKRDGYERFSNM